LTSAVLSQSKHFYPISSTFQGTTPKRLVS
jgi:hypothetical protein